MKKINHLPRNDTTNGWSRILPPREPMPALAREITADWVVVGAGFAGLAAAARLAENRPQESVVLLEAGEAGENASGRNSGFAIDVPHSVSSSFDELDGAHRHLNLARAAIAHLQQKMEAAGIECDWTRSGKYHAAATPRGRRELLEPFARELEALGESYSWVEREDLASALGTTHFTAAIHTPGCVLINPAGLTRGLAGGLPANVTLFETSPVIAMDDRNGVQLTTPSGSVRATRMILAVNGFAEQFGFLRGRLVHLALHASLTRPLSSEEQRAYGVDASWGLTPANSFAGATMRYTNDHRILIRERLDYCPSRHVSDDFRKSVSRRHKRLFDRRFPALPNVDMEFTWTGYVAISRNGAPGFGQLAPNVWSAVCQNGIGITKGTMSGLLAADMATGRDNSLIADMQALGSPSKLPPRPLLDICARAKLNWEVWSNRHEA